ncbi:GNAT family N-acetyltransferase [Novosphingobium sp. KCTC 2891]|uniref:GNAT family N-acetyltransferase n=1 Tax=Novosphingobium sp. KCTC 2891 TaxID=2989730 RepID=UPI002221DFF1|nr:GNAT family N-acetyltransferase [Novosphingobium sp. KCTC 2891]MCW1382308.1 GNAT family N-acetyltransferase [Novosphingobium sp. KCTC 2891]
MSFRLETARLALRAWRAEDAAPFLAMCCDPRVMEFLGFLQGPADIDAALARQAGFQDRHGYCFWAVERREDSAFLGFCGLKPGAEGTPLEGRIEIGWRLAHHAWGQGYAREAARASLDWGFQELPAEAIWAMTVPGNVRSWGLMERLGMRRVRDLDFDHPALAESDPLRPHIVYVADRTRD